VNFYIKVLGTLSPCSLKR